MPAFKIGLFGLLYFFGLTLGSKCPQDATSKLVVCYYKGEISLTNFNICNCTHVVFTNAVRKTEINNISTTEDTIKYLEIIREKKENLSTIFTLEIKQDETSRILKSGNRSEQLINGIVKFLQESHFDGIELNFKFSSDDGVSKDSYSSFVKNLSKILSFRHRRVKRDGYDVFEKLQDDITTVAYTTQTPKNSTSKTQSIKQRSRKPKENSRKIREEKDDDENDADYLTLEEAVNAEFSGEKSEKQNTLKDLEKEYSVEKKFLVFVRLSIKPEIIAKKYDLKVLSRYADILTVPTHNIVSSNEDGLTYHPSRLMGLSDILNTDSILDFLTGMGALKSKMVITLPATVLKFRLTDENKNTPRSPSGSKPQVVDQSQLCALFSKNNWTVERDDDLTAPYAFSGKTWLAFEDSISVNIKGKYILLRDLAGGAIYPIDSDLNDGLCRNGTGSNGYLTGVLHRNFENLERKPRALILESLQEELHDTSLTNIEAGVKLSEFRIVRVVDHSGVVHVVRKNTKTQFECSRQGYFSHPLGCNKFYRCVKFDQYSDEFTVFEYDCPAGLAFDERWEVCVWPGSLPHGAPCTGSSEIAPVPRSHYQCPTQEGYYADPENCRWFFACLDHARDGITPLTAYEFRCPFGLVFSEQRLACDWPWMVGSCGNRGVAGYVNIYSAGQSQGIHTATFINGGNLEASFGQYGGRNEETSFDSFGKKFGSILKETNTYNAQGSYQSAQSAGFGYIASQFDDNSNRASFASFPDYEISGGRILNKGGLVLNQNIAGISDAATGGVAEDLGGLNIRVGILGGSKSLGKEAGNLHQEIINSANGAQGKSNINFSKLEASKGNILTLSGGQISIQNSVPTPRPFSVSIPSVQINSEKISKYPEHLEFISTTPQTFLLKETPLKENINIHITEAKLTDGNQYSNSHGFTVDQPTVSAKISAALPTAETHAFGGILSEESDFSQAGAGVSLGTPSVNFGSISKIESNGFGQTSFQQNKFPSRISANQEAFTPGIPAVTGTANSDYKAGSFGNKILNEPVSTLLPLVTQKPGVHTFKYAARGSDSSQPFVSKESSFVSFSPRNQKITNLNSAGEAADILEKAPAVQASFLTNTLERQNLNSENVAFGQPGIPYDNSLVTLTPSVTINGAKTGPESGRLTAVSSGPAVTGFVHSSIDQKISNELKFNKPQSSYAAPVVTPKIEFQPVLKTGSNEYFGELGLVSNKIPEVTPKPDFQIFSQTGLNLNDATEKSEAVSVVTPAVPFESPKVIATTKNGFEQSGITELSKDFSKVYYNVPITTSQNNVNNFGQTNSFLQKEVLQEKISYGISDTPSEIKTGSIVHTGRVSQSFVKPTTSDIKFSQASVHIQPVQSAFGQQYSYSSFKQPENQFDSIQPFGIVSSTPKPKTEIFGQKIEQPKTLTEVTIEQQPIVSVGPISSTTIEQPSSTPRPFSLSHGVFSQRPPSQNFNYESGFLQPQTATVSTPAPVVSAAIPINGFEELPQSLDVNIISKSPQTYEKKVFETFNPDYQQTVVDIPFGGQKSNFKPEIKPFTPFAHVTTTPIPFTYKQEITSGIGATSAVYGKSNAYLPPATPKPKIFGSISQHSSQIPTVQFETTEKIQSLIQQEQATPVINQQFGFLKTKPLVEERRTKFIQQLPVEVNTGALVNQHLLKNEQPSDHISNLFPAREELVGVEISKSVEINPSQFFQSTDGPPRNLPAKIVEIQPQPFQVISQKTFQNKQVIQPFYPKKEKETVHTQINIPKKEHRGQFVFGQTNLETPKAEILERKQYLLPVVTSKPQISSVRYSTAKTINAEPPIVYSEESVNTAPALPVIEASRIPLTEQKETTILRTKTNYFQPLAGFEKSSTNTEFVDLSSRQPQEVISSKVNLLLPTSTEAPQFTVSKTDELSAQTYNSFDSQKISALIHPEIQSVLKPDINNFETSGYSFRFHRLQNFTSGRSDANIGSEIKYAINPNIEIPEPPREYILAQNGYATAAPDLATGVIQFTSKTAESGNTFKGSTYLPPQVSSRKKPTKTTVISAGNVNEDEFRDDNIQRLFEKHSGRFGEVINGKSGEFATKLIKGEEEGDIAINRDTSSTIRYEVSSTTPRQKSRGRQYHGAITSDVQAKHKYEEYEINGSQPGQKTFETDKGDQGKADIIKTTLDLKNLKLDKNKKTVIVVSQVSDANPVLIGKLAGQCSCQSNMLELRSKGKKSKNTLKRKNSQNRQSQATIVNEYLPPFESNQPSVALEEIPTPDSETVVIGENKPFKQEISYITEQSLVSSSTTAHPDLDSSTILSSLGLDGVLSITPKAVYAEERTKNKKKHFRGRTRFLQPSSVPSEDGSSIPLLSSVPASEIASTYDYSALSGDESRTQNEIDKGRDDGISKVAAGAAFDRYGPGGWRSFDETLQGSIDCKRPGLFRHPKYCNKFYACNYDPWKERYTLHVFNCPIHLTYDSSITACNWPVRGPACADDNLLV